MWSKECKVVPGIICTGSVSIKFRVGKFCFENIFPGFPWRTPKEDSALQSEDKLCICISNPDSDLGAQSVGSYSQWIKELSTSGFLAGHMLFAPEILVKTIILNESGSVLVDFEPLYGARITVLLTVDNYSVSMALTFWLRSYLRPLY